jgi:hypothetical protein
VSCPQQAAVGIDFNPMTRRREANQVKPMPRNLQKEAAGRRHAPKIPSDRDFKIYFAVTEDSLTLHQAGERFGLSHEQVRRIRNDVADHLYQENIDHSRRIKQRIETGLWAIIREAWEAWKRSKQGETSKTETDGYSGENSVELVKKTFRLSAGNSAFLKTMLTAYGELRSLWGLDTKSGQDVLDDVPDKHRAGSGTWEAFQAKLKMYDLEQEIAERQKRLEALQQQIQQAGEN